MRFSHVHQDDVRLLARGDGTDPVRHPEDARPADGRHLDDPLRRQGGRVS